MTLLLTIPSALWHRFHKKQPDPVREQVVAYGTAVLIAQHFENTRLVEQILDELISRTTHPNRMKEVDDDDD